ncbi:DoxX family protein [Actinokineospora sp. G85]|uniref:DoxX family protein n=1 Tax=Actinokineospora sp. G85 TaxID=3406626 RepID=UPI003C751A86
MILRRIARPMLAGIFIAGGINVLRNPEAHVEASKPFLTDAVDKVGPSLPQQVPTDPVALVRIDGAVKVGAGVLLALGKFPRLSALLLSGSMVPTTLAAHRFWEEKDPEVRQQQQIHFLKNVSLLGGLLLAAADTGGKPSLGWRAKRAGRRASQSAHELSAWTAGTTDSVGSTLGKAPQRARKVVTSAADDARKAFEAAVADGGKQARKARRAVEKAPKRARKTIEAALPR